MAYDGFYADLSTRGSANEILNLVLDAKNDVDQSVNDAEEFSSYASESSSLSKLYADQSSISASESNQARVDAELSALAAAASAQATGRFIVVSPTPPTERSNNTPLQEADEWQDSTSHIRRSWTGTSWVALNSTTQELEAALANPSEGARKVAFDGDETTVESALRSRAKGNPGITYNLIGGAIRRDTSISSDWQIISDNAHKQSNLLSITNGVEAVITYNGNKIVSLVVGSDERWAACGIVVGASVGANIAYLRMGAPCVFKAKLGAQVGEVEADSRLFRSGRFGTSVAASGLITITHPQRQAALLPIVQHITDSSSAEIAFPFDVRSPSPGITTLYLKTQMRGRINYTGANWAVSNSPFPNSDYTFSYDTTSGVLSVTHPMISGNVQPTLTPYGQGSTDYNVSVFESTGVGFKVKFRKLSDGTIPVGTPTDMGFFFDRGVNAINKTPQGSLSVDLGTVQVDMNDVDFPLGNAWIIGIMEA